MGKWLQCLWSGCGSPVFPQNWSSQKHSLMGIFLPLSFLISKMKLMISSFDAFYYIKSKWIWFFTYVLCTIISMIVMKMKSILHNRWCQLLSVVSSKRIFILFPSFCLKISCNTQSRAARLQIRGSLREGPRVLDGACILPLKYLVLDFLAYEKNKSLIWLSHWSWISATCSQAHPK